MFATSASGPALVLFGYITLQAHPNATNHAAYLVQPRQSNLCPLGSADLPPLHVP
jgi:hypothetical protein